MKTITEMQLMTMVTVMTATLRRFDDSCDIDDSNDSDNTKI